MKVLTQKILESYNPCYPASEFYNKRWKGTVVDIAKDVRIHFKDRLWAVLRPEHVSEKFARLFAVWCARQVRKNNPNPQIKSALDTAVAYAFGETSMDCLRQSNIYAKAAARQTNSLASSYAGLSAVAASSCDDSVHNFAREASAYACRSAASFGADNRSDIRYFEVYKVDSEKAQEKQLIAMLEEGVKTGDVK